MRSNRGRREERGQVGQARPYTRKKKAFWGGEKEIDDSLSKTDIYKEKGGWPGSAEEERGRTF